MQNISTNLTDSFVSHNFRNSRVFPLLPYQQTATGSNKRLHCCYYTVVLLQSHGGGRSRSQFSTRDHDVIMIMGICGLRKSKQNNKAQSKGFSRRLMCVAWLTNAQSNQGPAKICSKHHQFKRCELFDFSLVIGIWRRRWA